MIKTLAVGLALFAMAAQAQTTEFKGIPFGASEAQFRRALPKFHCDKTKEASLGDRVCIAVDDDKIEFGGVIPATIVAGFLRDQMVSVMVKVRGEELPGVLRALESKFGESLPNSINTSFDWRTKDGVHITAKRGIDGLIFMRNDTAIKEIMERSGAAGAKSL
jgi:hypothetical protein